MTEHVCNAIKSALDTDNGALIGRNGSTEINVMINGTRIGAPLYSYLTNNAGIFPLNTIESINEWRLESIEATKAADVLVSGWYEPVKNAEEAALKSWNVTAVKIPLRALEPYYVEPEQQWSALLSGHRVAVVTSFTSSAKLQIAKGPSKLWGDHGVLPKDVDWVWIQTGFPPHVANGINEWPANVNSWKDAANHIVANVITSGARFALIGCGGIGMIIAKMLKDRGVIAIVMGGAIQVLFGIKGKRWATHQIISKFWNSEWVWPFKIETPRMASSIENACYWG